MWVRDKPGMSCARGSDLCVTGRRWDQYSKDQLFSATMYRGCHSHRLYRAFSCDVTVTWKPYGRPFWCAVEWRLSMLHDVRAKYSPDLTADGLTSQVCSISLPGTLYVRCERTRCIVPDFPIQAPIYLYTKTAVMHTSITELCRLASFLITWRKRSIVMVAVASQNFDQLFSAFDCWPCWFLGLWSLTMLNFNRWPLTMRTLILWEYTEECIATPPLP